MKWLVMFFVNIRWAYFHINPRYMKFQMSGTEVHFHDTKKNVILSNYIWEPTCTQEK